ncbi:hypothetical protein ABBQ32_010394 [Trebouxia sp. C0010 RCD-2024]
MWFLLLPPPPDLLLEWDSKAAQAEDILGTGVYEVLAPQACVPTHHATIKSGAAYDKRSQLARRPYTRIHVTLRKTGLVQIPDRRVQV